jgi:hypothetical protein
MQVPLSMASAGSDKATEEKADAPAVATKSEEPPAKKIDIEPTSSGSAAAAVAVAPPTSAKIGKKMDERIFNLNKQIIDRVYDLICFFYPVKVCFGEGMNGGRELQRAIESRTPLL